jgi:integrase
MVAVAQLVRAPDCGSGSRGFKSRQSPSTQVPLAEAFHAYPGEFRARLPNDAYCERVSQYAPRNPQHATTPETHTVLPRTQAIRKTRAVWTDSTGERQFRMLPGPFESVESRTAFAQLELELIAAPHRVPDREPSEVSVNEMLEAFRAHAEQHYRRGDGSITNEYHEYRLTIRYVRELYGHTPARSFGPLALKAIRQKFVEAGWCRGFINQRIGRIRRMFKWAASEELVPPTIYQALITVSGLQRGRTPAKETEPVVSVADAIVDATLQYLNRHVRGLMEFQRLTGCRAGEACNLRRADIDTGGSVWLYKPKMHKTTWRGKSRTIAIGPKAQELLKKFFTPDRNAYLFSPTNEALPQTDAI